MTNRPLIPAARPTPRFVADAMHVVTNPGLYADRPLLRRLAWAVLMAGRGSAPGSPGAKGAGHAPVASLAPRSATD